MTSGRFGPESTCSPIYNETLETQLNNAIENLNSEIDNIQIDEISDNEEISIPAIPEVRNFSYAIVDNQIYYRASDDEEFFKATGIDKKVIKNAIKFIIEKIA